MEAELLKNCLFCRRTPLQVKATSGREWKCEANVLKWKADALQSLCRLFYLSPEDTWVKLFHQGGFCSDCQLLIWEAHSSFKMIDKLQETISDIRSILNQRLEKNCRVFRKSRFFDDEITPFGRAVDACYEGFF